MLIYVQIEIATERRSDLHRTVKQCAEGNGLSMADTYADLLRDTVSLQTSLSNRGQLKPTMRLSANATKRHSRRTDPVLNCLASAERSMSRSFVSALTYVYPFRTLTKT